VFNQAGVLGAADVHVARRLARLAGEADEQVALAVALAVRAPRFGHVLVDLSSVATGLAGVEEGAEAVDLEALPWPGPSQWLEKLAASPLVAGEGEDAGDVAVPLRLVGARLYLARHWEEERAVAAALLQRAVQAVRPVGSEVVAGTLTRLFGPSWAVGNEQAEAAQVVLRHHLAVVAGGPGTGKTTTIARILAALDEVALAAQEPRPLVALAAPTGKAAARLAEAVQWEAGRMPVSPAVRERLAAMEASTVHRLLGRQPGSVTRPRYDRFNRLPHDVVVVDETSMMSLSLMASLVGAVRPEARLVLVGDPEQLASVEAGAVLGDIVAPARAGPRTSPITACTSLLTVNHRFGGPLAQLAAAVRDGDAERAVEVLRGDGKGAGHRAEAPVRWLALGPGGPSSTELAPARELVLTAGAQVEAAAARGDGPAALAAAGRLRVLCAHRHGPWGASTWNALAQSWLAAGDVPEPAPDVDEVAQWYLGRPVMVTANDYTMGLFNGDLGVSVARPGGGLSVVFQRPAGLAAFSPSRLSSVVTAYAMTAHRAQGSEFDQVVVVLPEPSSRILTRELLYTAVTRARRGLLLLGTEEAVRVAVGRPVARASGLTDRLYGHL
jgi:exodeoxyribonuclease V alpha subunit